MLCISLVWGGNGMDLHQISTMTDCPDSNPWPYLSSLVQCGPHRIRKYRLTLTVACTCVLTKASDKKSVCKAHKCKCPILHPAHTKINPQREEYIASPCLRQVYPLADSLNCYPLLTQSYAYIYTVYKVSSPVSRRNEGSSLGYLSALFYLSMRNQWSPWLVLFF